MGKKCELGFGPTYNKLYMGLWVQKPLLLWTKHYLFLGKVIGFIFVFTDFLSDALL